MVMKISKKITSLLLALITIITCMICLSTATVFAADKPVKVEKTYIKHLTLEDSKIIVSWKTIDDCTGYQIQYGTSANFDSSKTLDISDKTMEKYNMSGFTPEMWYFRIRTVKNVDGVNYYSDWSNTKSINFKFTKTYLMHQVSENNVLNITWKNVSCSSYAVQISKDENFETYQTVTFAKRTFSTEKLTGSIGSEMLTPGTYYLRIRAAHKVDGKYYYSEWSNTKTVEYKIAKTYIKTIKSIDNRIDMNWKIVENCTGYQIQYSNYSDMSEPTNVDIPDCDFDFYSMGYQMVPGRYYVRIRTVNNVDGVDYYSDWSNIKTVTYAFAKTYLTNQYAKNGEGYAFWKVVDCDGYQIQISPDPTFAKNATLGYILDGTIGACKGIPITKGENYIRIRPFKVIGNIRYFAAWSNTKTFTVQ